MTINDPDQARRRAELARQTAARLGAHADTLRQRADGMYDRFAGGQPILLGHHSAPRALKDRARADNATRRSIEADRAHRAAAGKAAMAEGMAELAEALAARGRPWQPSDFRPGDAVEVRSHRMTVDLYEVKRVNRTTLTLVGPGGGFDDPRRTYDRVLARIRSGTRVSDPATLD
ncbi:DUF3560 domain-containing protein [Streptomyces sp. NPDC004520]|uniref:DUF3560 domain-containing protein n=1 Tax=Streptomyces sp. NPDC004520 TaxID=3364702 RepID=UPI0036B43C09